MTKATLNDFASMAMKASSEEFLHLIEKSTRLMSHVKKQSAGTQVEGRLLIVPPVRETVIIGDIHGDFESLTHILDDCKFLNGVPEGKETPLLIFLGDYGDRGIYSPEVYYTILKLKTLFPEKVVLMMGNHEGPEDLLAYPHDLPSHLQRKFGSDWQKVYSGLREVFSYLYTAVIVSERYVLFHGGVPSKAHSIDDIAYAHKKHPRETHLEEMLWSDPLEKIRGTRPSPRGAGKLFGEDVTDRILKMLNVKVVIRGHEPCENGFKINHGGKILTLFSRKGEPYYNEQGAFLKLDLSDSVENANQLDRYVHKF